MWKINAFDECRVLVSHFRRKLSCLSDGLTDGQKEDGYGEMTERSDWDRGRTRYRL